MAGSAEGGQALFAIVRYWSRRWMAGSGWEEGAGGDANVQSILVLEAIVAVRGDRPCSIGDVARQIGVDHSVASRMVSRAEREGLIRKRRSTRDPRQVELEILPAGAALLDEAHRWQASAFADLTRDWPPEDAARFATYLSRLRAELGI